jgi:hypothetical protein
MALLLSGFRYPSFLHDRAKGVEAGGMGTEKQVNKAGISIAAYETVPEILASSARWNQALSHP